MTARRGARTQLAVTAVLHDGGTEFLFTRTIAAGERVSLLAEARAAMRRRALQDDRNERRMVRQDRPRTVSVYADLLIGGRLADREEAFR
ncbi:hypothetical protein [Amycolatopsis suaedae]|uniref:Uncharacterized protein n=1 Tax=Amycolatopsis suaedae TaxID=2510978 RepID=A0A4Q7J4D2_9PSEU|nr:hypothetical protein [Amycolatopsis suaedae]RZQ60854.1 hypothetical protein EWH70_27535 [Amycolatopsis suaedae]